MVLIIWRRDGEGAPPAAPIRLWEGGVTPPDIRLKGIFLHSGSLFLAALITHYYTIPPSHSCVLNEKTSRKKNRQNLFLPLYAGLWNLFIGQLHWNRKSYEFEMKLWDFWSFFVNLHSKLLITITLQVYPLTHSDLKSGTLHHHNLRTEEDSQMKGETFSSNFKKKSTRFSFQAP